MASTVPMPSAGELLGKWEAQATLPDRGVCTEKLELRQSGQGMFVGYSSLLCINLNPYMGGAKPDYRGAALAALDRYNPVASVLTGAWENGSLKFHAEKNIGVNPAEGRCAMTSFSVTPFGSQIASEWQDGSCGGGQLLLKKTGL